MSPTINCLQCKLLHCLSEEWHRWSCNWIGVWNLYQNFCKIPVWIHGLGKKLGPVVLVALRAYHTPPLMSCSDIWWNNVFSADQYLLFWGSIFAEFAERGNQISPWNRIIVGLISPSCTSWGTSSQSLVLLHDICHRVCELHLCYMVAIAAANNSDNTCVTEAVSEPSCMR